MAKAVWGSVEPDLRRGRAWDGRRSGGGGGRTFGEALRHGLEVLVTLEGLAGVLVDLAEGRHGHDQHLGGRTPVVGGQHLPGLGGHGAVVVLHLGLRSTAGLTVENMVGLG